MTSALFAPLNDQAAEQLRGGKRFTATKNVSYADSMISATLSVDDNQNVYEGAGTASLDTSTGAYSYSFTFGMYSFSGSGTLSL
jgi:hypothetical protein